MLALRTGINLQPLLDLNIESLKPSILDGRLELTVKKNRGYSVQKTSVKDTDGLDELAYVSKRVGPIIGELIEISEELRVIASTAIALSLWLVSEQTGEIRILNSDELWVNIQRFRDKYELKDDAGNPLQINIRRMRPTFAHALLRINGGDLRDLQKRLNHKNIETTMGYLDANQDEFKSSFRFRGIIMQHALGGGNSQGLAKELNCTITEAENMLRGENGMLVGTCKNPFDSPITKNYSSPCTQFTSCFRCHNQVVTKEDAHKIFSFYWFLLNKKNAMPQKAWERSYAWIIRTIDQDIAPNLGNAKEIDILKQNAVKNPHPAWPNKKIKEA